MKGQNKFGEAIGVWHLTVGNADLELKPKLGDNRKFRKILMNNTKDKDVLMDKFEEFMFELIKRDNPDDPDERIKEYIEYNVQDLFEETMVRFRWTTKESLDQSKKEAMGDIKKSIGES